MSFCVIVSPPSRQQEEDPGSSNRSTCRKMTTDLNQILTDVAAGKPDGVEACLRHFSGPVWGLARRYLHNDGDAEDATQDIFVDLWKSAGRFDPALGSAMTFVMTLARRRLIDRNRKRGRAPVSQSLSDADELVSPDRPDSLELGDEVQRISGAMEGLRPHQREVLELSLVYGHSHQQISETTGLALGTVKSHARRGLMRVRELLGVNQQDEGDES